MTKYLVFWTNYFYFVPQAAKAPTNERENKSIKTLINKKHILSQLTLVNLKIIFEPMINYGPELKL